MEIIDHLSLGGERVDIVGYGAWRAVMCGGGMWGVDGPHAIMMVAGTVDWGILGVVKNNIVVGESGDVATIT